VTSAGADAPSPVTDPAPGPPPAAGAEDVESLQALWPAVVEQVRADGNALLGALIAEAQPVAIDGEDLTVAFATTAPFLKKKAEDPANRATVAQALKELTGRRVRLTYELREELTAAAHETVAQAGGRSEEEWVARFMAEFDAEELPGEWVAGQKGE